MQITRKIEFDAGHRIPNHKSKCRNFHGHRYVLEVTVSGEIRPVEYQSDDGMVVDFGDIKRIMMEKIHDPFDHGFLVWSGDVHGLAALAVLGDHKTVVLPFVPTAENLAQHIREVLDHEIRLAFGGRVSVERVVLYETPNSSATC